jgi:uncharacterized protein YqjF (DUF2071 family)
MIDWALAPALAGRPLFDQHWNNLTFLHWPIDPAQVAPFCPPGIHPDVLDGVTYVGLVPFHMQRAGLGRLEVPYLGDFLETNVRLYTVDDEGHHGVLFRTLDAQRLATVLLARYGYAVPYTWARMSCTRDGDELTYRTDRRWPRRGLGSTVRVEVGAPIHPTDTEVWFTARWGLHSRLAGRSLWTPNYHDPWPLHEARVLELDDQLVAAAGLTVDPTQLMRPLWSPGVHTQFGRPTRVG